MEFALTHPDSGLKEILVIFDGVPYEANSDHPWWDEIIRLCLADDERVLDLFPIRPVQTASREIPIEEADPPVDEEAEEWEDLYGIAMRRVFELRDDLREAEANTAEERGRSGFLEAAIRQYASHVYREIMNSIDSGDA